MIIFHNPVQANNLYHSTYGIQGLSKWSTISKAESVSWPYGQVLVQSIKTEFLLVYCIGLVAQMGNLHGPSPFFVIRYPHGGFLPPRYVPSLPKRKQALFGGVNEPQQGQHTYIHCYYLDEGLEYIASPRTPQIL